MTPQEIVRKARELTGLTQLDLARLMGTDRNSVNRWEMGMHDPSVAVLQRLAQVTGLVLTLEITPAQSQPQSPKTGTPPPRQRAKRSAPAARAVSTRTRPDAPKPAVRRRTKSAKKQ